MIANARLQWGIQLGLIILVALMPFHAFLSVWLGSLTHHQAIIQSWKEVLLVVLGLATAALVVSERERLQRLHQPWIYLAGGLLLLGLVVTAAARPSATTAIFGLKTDFEFLAAAIIAVLVSTKPFLNTLTKTILIGAGVVAGFDLLQIFVLPPDFLTAFGYGPATILPYQHIAEGTNFLRYPATLGGPNQLGTYLILPLCLTAAAFVRRPRLWPPVLFAACLVSLIWTFSRGAWIGAAAAVLITVIAALPVKWRRAGVITGAAAVVASLALLPLAIEKGGPLQYFILHSSAENHDQAHLSDSQHASSLQYGLTNLQTSPFGHGLGTAGPSTFHAGTVNIIENYYLQLGYEMGDLAVLLFLALLAAVIWGLSRAPRIPLAIPTAAAIVGISLVGLVLPAWVDSTTALIVWTCAGAVTGARYV
jgi:hypothetical protein